MKEHKNLPAWAKFLLRHFVHGSLLEEIEGDILANYLWRVKNSTPLKAKLHLLLDTLSAIRFLVPTFIEIPSIMIVFNYVKTFSRKIKNDTGNYAFHLFGLAVGISCFLGIFSFYLFEHSYDNYHENADRIYRIERIIEQQNGPLHSSRTSQLIPQYVSAEIPEVTDVASLVNGRFNTANFQYPENTPWGELKYHYADSGFTDVFNIKLLSGNARTALKEKQTIVLTQSLAKKLFLNESPLEKSVFINEVPFRVTGVVEDVKRNTHFDFDYLISVRNILEMAFYDQEKIASEWTYANFFMNYIRISKNTDIDVVLDKLTSIYNRVTDNNEVPHRYVLTPVTDIHLHSDTDLEFQTNANASFINTVFALGIVILLLTIVNFTTISIAKSAVHSKEFGMRKVLGSSKIQIALQLLLENIFSIFFAVILSLGSLYLLINGLSVTLPISMEPSQLLQVDVILIILSIILVSSFLPSIYPIGMQFKVAPLDAIKGKVLGKEKDFGILKGLVVVQVAFSFFLISSTYFFTDQIDYILNKDVGFAKNNVLYMERHIRGESAPSFESFKSSLLTIPGINSVTSSAQLPLRWPAGQVYDLIPEEGEFATVACSRGWIGYDYFKTLGVEMTLGRDFSQEFISDSSAIIINEAAATSMGLDNPIGKKMRIAFRGGREIRTREIVGVVKNFNFRDLHTEVLPSYFILATIGPAVSVNYNSEALPEVMNGLKEKWAEFSPEEVFNMTFLDEHFAFQHRQDITFKNSIQILSFIIILLACLGLYGVASYTAQRRLKEMSIRKILGADSSSIFWLMTRFYIVVCLIILILCSIPVYLFVDNWISNFAYQAPHNFTHYLKAFIVLSGIVLFVTGIKSLKATLANPVQTLKDE